MIPTMTDLGGGIREEEGTKMRGRRGKRGGGIRGGGVREEEG
jgi:hypothetical protein